MAVQKSRKTRATRGHRRAHDKLSPPTLAIEPETGELHRRHHLTPNGFYRGRQVVKLKSESAKETEE